MIKCIICDVITHELTRITHTNPATSFEESICLTCHTEITTIVQTEPVPDVPTMILPKLPIY